VRREERSKSRKVGKLDKETSAARVGNEWRRRDKCRQSPRKENGWERGKRVWAGCHRRHEKLRDSHRQASTIIKDMKAKIRCGRKGEGRERVFRQR
jgi:hypothetical protein